MDVLIDNLVLLFWRVTKREFVAIWAIVLTNAVTGVYLNQSLLIALGVGVAASAAIFMSQVR